MTDTVSILMTAAGAPQSPTLIRHLRENGETKVRIISMDMNGEAVGRFMSDSFHQIPAAGSTGYRQAIFDILAREKPDALLNVSGHDVWPIAKMKQEIEAMGVKVICSDPEDIELVNNKYRLFQSFQNNKDVPVPAFSWPRTVDEFVAQAEALGYPHRDVCFKPHVSKGSRGFRILSEKFDRRDLLLNHKPISRYMALDDFVSIFRDSDSLPDLMLMEVAEGEEHDAMTIGWEGEALLTTIKSRESNRWGVIDLGAHIDRPATVRSVAAIVKKIPLKFNFSIQFIGGKLIEINPRTSTFIYQDDLNEPWLAIKLALGMITPDEVKGFQSKVRMGRRMVRYMDQIFFEPDGSWSN